MKFSTNQALGIVGGPVLALAGYWTYGWPGLALVVGGGIMWALLHFTRIMQLLKRASTRPKGWVASAIMLNAKLSPGLGMMKVIALTGSLGEGVDVLDAATQTESWRWADDGGIAVTVWFVAGKVTRWELLRPEVLQPAA